MADVVSREEVARLRDSDGPYTRLANSHEELRARLESAEAALREIREIIGIDDPMIQESLRRGYEFAIEVGQVKRLAELLDAALGAAGERSEDG